MAVITASNILAAQNPSDPTGTILTFTRSDTGQQVQLPVSVLWSADTVAQDVALLKSAIQAWEAEANGLAAVNAAAAGQIV